MNPLASTSARPAGRLASRRVGTPPALRRATPSVLLRQACWAAATLVMAAGALAQSSNVTLYGRIDLQVGRNIGSKDKVLQTGSGNRLGLRGNEDLGGGWKAFFNIEHGMNSDTGSTADNARFWNRRSFAGVETPWGTVQLGRDYTAAYLDAQLLADPFGNNYTSSMLRFSNGGITPVRFDSSLRFTSRPIGPVTLSAHVAEATDTINRTVDKPVAATIKYEGKGLYLAYSYENPGGAKDDWHFATGIYTLGEAKLSLGLGSGHTNAGNKTDVVLLAGTYVTGPWELKGAFGTLKDKTARRSLSEKLALGAYYSMSKRTVLYMNLSNDRKATVAKSGYDLGILHFY